MTLTDLANHICTQCGMTDTDDVAAAQMFLQRRLEMIWNSALWRDSLLEATLTVNPDGTTSLADSYWIPQRSVLLLPSAIEKVIAARLNTNTLEVASLESYYRADTDWLDYQGTPFEFQILKPVVMEWPVAQVVSALDTNAADATASPAISFNFSYSPDGVTITNGTVGSGSTTGQGAIIGSGGSTTGNGSTTGGGQVLQLFSFSKPATQGTVSLQTLTSLISAGAQYNNGAYEVDGLTVGGTYYVTFGANEGSMQNGSQILTASGSFVAQGTSVTIFENGEAGDSNKTNVTAAMASVVTFATLAPGCNNAAMHQRIRLTEAPQVSINLRVLGKGKCPVLGPYDTTPITNSEPALMAFARGDLLLRQRQFGKAALAQQEGAALLKELVENEAFQQAGEFRIQPDGGFGSDIWWCTQPDSFHPLG